MAGVAEPRPDPAVHQTVTGRFVPVLDGEHLGNRQPAA